MKSAAPENFVRHPISHPRKHLLLQQQGLERSVCPPRGVARDSIPRELRGQNFGWQLGPPRRQIGAPVEANDPEHARIAEHEASRRLADDQMIVGAGLVVPALDEQLPRHAQVHSEAGVFENKEHLLPAGVDLAEPPARESPG